VLEQTHPLWNCYLSSVDMHNHVWLQHAIPEVGLPRSRVRELQKGYNSGGAAAAAPQAVALVLAPKGARGLRAAALRLTTRTSENCQQGLATIRRCATVKSTILRSLLRDPDLATLAMPCVG